MLPGPFPDVCRVTPNPNCRLGRRQSTQLVIKLGYQTHEGARHIGESEQHNHPFI